MSEPIITLNDMVECAAREVRHRRQMYPAIVARERMSQADADREIAVREAIYRYLQHDLEVVLRRPATS